MGKHAAGAELPVDLHGRFTAHAAAHPKGKSGLIKDSLREYMDNHPIGNGDEDTKPQEGAA